MPATTKVLVIPSSTRANSAVTRLAALATKELALIEADVTRISLVDYPLPVYDADVEQTDGIPYDAVKLKRAITAHEAVFLVSDELNAGPSPLLVNMIGWVSRVRERGDPPLAALRNRVFALGAVDNGSLGGVRALMALRQILEVGCGALVIPEEIALARSEQAFDVMDQLRDESAAGELKLVLRRLVEVASLMEARSR